MQPWHRLISLPATIPGISAHTAEVVLAEIGPDVTRFPTAGHLASWAGVCPGNHESAGKSPTGRI
ncbi:IS110 family transposase [Pseudonocardia bannensis]|uniref:transposase n=1 Tax=Pseudonocardia bannensis TaxID=630973 RepID=UPI001B7D001B|nr:transposase [Pseudonocardia bannensis]